MSLYIEHGLDTPQQGFFDIQDTSKVISKSCTNTNFPNGTGIKICIQTQLATHNFSVISNGDKNELNSVRQKIWRAFSTDDFTDIRTECEIIYANKIFR